MIDMSILITGGSGYFAQGLVGRLLRDGSYRRICIFSRGEHAQAAMRGMFRDDARLRWFIGDVRDLERLRRAMAGCREVVHCAALKRIEACHYNPDEMVKTNVVGAMNVIEAARACGVSFVVGLSSDKAFQPVSAYGQSKALAESLFLASNVGAGPRFACVRYGNVWGSTGSVVPLWRGMIEGGAVRVPVTDPECTRFFMRRGEAVELVLETLRTMRGGELVIPDLPAYRVGDLAEALGVEMDVRGLVEFEKLHESMSEGRSSDTARRLTVEELKEVLREG